MDDNQWSGYSDGLNRDLLTGCPLIWNVLSAPSQKGLEDEWEDYTLDVGVGQVEATRGWVTRRKVTHYAKSFQVNQLAKSGSHLSP